MSMITATTWVPRGFAAAFPTKYEFNEDEYARIAKLAKLQLEDAEEDLAEARAAEEASKSETGGSGSKADAACVCLLNHNGADRA
jgi:periodic tryptophan protein 1